MSLALALVCFAGVAVSNHGTRGVHQRLDFRKKAVDEGEFFVKFGRPFLQHEKLGIVDRIDGIC